MILFLYSLTQRDDHSLVFNLRTYGLPSVALCGVRVMLQTLNPIRPPLHLARPYSAGSGLLTERGTYGRCVLW